MVLIVLENICVHELFNESVKIYLTAIQCHSIDKIIRVVMSTTAIFNFLSC